MLIILRTMISLQFRSQNLFQFLHKLGPKDQICFIAFGFTWYQGRPPVDRHESNDFHPAPQLAF
jgi:hypothetical protein